MINKIINSLLNQYNSFYVYDESKISSSIKNLQSNFKNVTFLYSAKANPDSNVLDYILSQNIGVDAASVNEVLMAEQRGIDKAQIQYSAPGKTKKDINDTIKICTIVADSLNEIELINETAHQQNMIAQIGVRINPCVGFDGNSAAASKFGIDENQFIQNLNSIKQLKNIKIIGIHIHLKSQELSINSLKRYYENQVALFNKFQQLLDNQLTFINFGSGIGVAYNKNDEELDLKELGEFVSNLVVDLAAKNENLNIYIETGRYLVCAAGVYVSKVVDKKVSNGETFVVLASTLNGFIRPSMQQLILSYCMDTNAMPSEPFFTKTDAYEIVALTKSVQMQKVTLVGSLCTALDVMAKDIELKKLDIGDGILITNAGSYAAVISPMQFASLNKPRQIYVKTNGEILINE